jgi:hypothetical protein
LDGNVWEFACNILLWSWDRTEVNFIHSPSRSRPSPSRRNQSAVNVDVIGPFWCCMNTPSSLMLSRFLDSWITTWRVVSFVQMSLSSSISCPSSEMFGYACDQSWQMGVNLSGASNVWSLLAECTYVYSRYVWLYYWG